MVKIVLRVLYYLAGLLGTLKLKFIINFKSFIIILKYAFNAVHLLCLLFFKKRNDILIIKKNNFLKW